MKIRANSLLVVSVFLDGTVGDKNTMMEAVVALALLVLDERDFTLTKQLSPRDLLRPRKHHGITIST